MRKILRTLFRIALVLLTLGSCTQSVAWFEEIITDSTPTYHRSSYKSFNYDDYGY